MKPALVVTIDTEEEGLWRGVLRAEVNRCRNVLRLPRAHALFTRLGVKPTYLVDHPVATDPDARLILAELAARGGAEIGAHLHPWCTPPLVTGGTALLFSYPHQLPPGLQRLKLATLIDVLVEAFGVRPTSYRAGRWGFGASSVQVLAELGIRVDTSVKALWWDPARGGPRFHRAPLMPYRVAVDDVCAHGNSAVFEVPTSGAILGAHGPRLERLVPWVPAAPGLRRVLRALGARTLDAESEAGDDMCRVVDAIAARALPLFNVTFHSSTLLAGATPYAPAERDVDAFLARLEKVLEYALGRHDAVPLGVSEVPRYFGAATVDDPPRASVA